MSSPTAPADLVILGGGSGGYAAALRAAELGIPVYDAQVTGYPQRMRDYNTRNKKHPDLR